MERVRCDTGSTNIRIKNEEGIRLHKSLPGLDSLHMAGQWVEVGGGLPAAAMSGLNLIQIICKKDKKEFVTTTPEVRFRDMSRA